MTTPDRLSAAAFLLACAATHAGAQDLAELRRALPVNEDIARDVLAADLDGDGREDLVIVGGPSSTVAHHRLLRQVAPHVFRADPAFSLPAGLGSSARIAAADFDGDLDLDLFLGGQFSPAGPAENQLLLGDGTGAFSLAAPGQLPPPSPSVGGLAVLDAEGDGDADLALAASSNLLYLNDGSATFVQAPSTDLPPHAELSSDVGAADLDGDGDADLLFGNGGDLCFAFGQERLYLNDGLGVFADATGASLPAVADCTSALALADVDLDGDVDALLAGDGVQRLLQNDGAAVFADVSATHLPVLGALTGEVVLLEDLDGDGAPEGLIGFAGGPQDAGTALLSNDGSGHFTDAGASGIPPGIGRSAAALVRADGDADLDLVLAGSEGRRQEELLLNDGSGSFELVTARSLPPGPSGSRALVLAELNGDGDLDLVLAPTAIDSIAQPARLLFHRAAGAFVDAPPGAFPGAPLGPGILAAGDADGDGDQDLFANEESVPGAPALLVYSNDGAGSFQLASSVLSSLFDHEIGLGDLDGDGDLDAALIGGGFPGPSSLRVALGDGSGAYAVGATQASFSSGTGLALYDAELDGDLDLAASDVDPLFGFAQPLQLLFNDGDAAFQAQASPGSFAALDVDAGDLDADGDADLVVAKTAGNLVLWSDGLGGLSPLAVGGNASQSSCAALGDPDGDGDLDLFFGNPDEPNALLLNQAGAFVDASAAWLEPDRDWTEAAAFGDLDRDGDEDLVLASSLQFSSGARGTDRVLVNLRSELFATNLAAPGQPLHLELRGDPLQLYFLAISPVPAELPLPFGVLGLDPGTLVTVDSGALDSGGAVEWAFPVSATAPVGVDAYFQAALVIFDPLVPVRLTNREIVTLGDL